MLSLELPHILWLAPLPLLVRRLLPAASAVEASLPAPFFERWRELQGPARDTAKSRPLRLLCLSLLWLSLLLATARPGWLGEAVPQTVSGREMLLAVDLSGSMKIEDMVLDGEQSARIDAVKRVVGEFVSRRQGDKVGLVLFGTQAYHHVPLTFDLATLRTLLAEAQPGFAGKYTAIGDAIGLATKRLMDRPVQSRVVILLTDGANTAGVIEPIAAAELAAGAGIRIYTIGVGANEMLVPGLFGSSLGARRVNPSADLDEQSLQKIAELTGGRYFRATNTEELAGIYQLLDRLEPTGRDEFVYRARSSLAHWPLALAFALSLLIAIDLALPARWRGSLRV